MRILMTADTVGGVFHYAVELIAALRARGIEVVLATMGRALSPEQRAQLAPLDLQALHEGRWALEWMPDRWDEVEACGRWLQQIAERTAPDCIHFNHYVHASLPWPAPVVVVGHSCVLTWWQAVHGTRPSREYARYEREVRAGLRAADVVIAPSAAMLGGLIRHYGPFAQSRVIANGIELDAFPPLDKREFVFAAGRFWDHGKNLAALQRIAPALEWPVYVAGETRAPDRDDEGTSGTAPGWLPRSALARCLGRASIYALPARYEPFGLSVLEAAAAGCALVLGRIPSLLENWQAAALFVDPDEPAELEGTLRQLIADPTLRASLGAAARERAQGFGARRAAEAYLRTYRTAIDARRREGLPCAS